MLVSYKQSELIVIFIVGLWCALFNENLSVEAEQIPQKLQPAVAGDTCWFSACKAV